jgi:hypothetical protein
VAHPWVLACFFNGSFCPYSIVTKTITIRGQLPVGQGLGPKVVVPFRIALVFSLRPLRLFFALFAVKALKAINRKVREGFAKGRKEDQTALLPGPNGSVWVVRRPPAADTVC